MKEMNVANRGNISKTKLLLIGLSVLIIVVMVLGYYAIPQVYLDGENVVLLNYKEEYKERGYKASFLGRDVTDKVKVSGSVNSLKLGDYKIVYEVDGWFKRRVVRTVKVKDKSKPVIDVSDDKEIYVCPGNEYSSEKIEAHDNYDGDISDKVLVDVSKNKVIFSVKDSSGNKTVIKKKIIYDDKTDPVVNLNGSKYVYAFLNEEYVDQGSSASDNCSGDLTSKVKVSSDVDISKTGKYEVKYSVVDNNGNSSSETRTVVVSKRDNPGTIYLTFDDGPQKGTTDVILDILKEEGVEATFFVTTKGPDELIKRMVDEGHTVALHTATHDYATVYSSFDSYFNDLNIVNERVKRITGEYSYIIRFPGGSSNTISKRYSKGIMTGLTEEVINRGYKYYDWNISSGDADGGRPTPEQIKDNVIRRLKKDRINMVLMHDVKTYTRDALREIIRYGKDNGYTFEKITMDTEMVRQKVNN